MKKIALIALLCVSAIFANATCYIGSFGNGYSFVATSNELGAITNIGFISTDCFGVWAQSCRDGAVPASGGDAAWEANFNSFSLATMRPATAQENMAIQSILASTSNYGLDMLNANNLNANIAFWINNQ